MNRKTLLISAALMALSACAPKEETQSSESLTSCSDESVSSSSEASSQIETRSSESSPVSLSDDKVYCTVSIYQSYLPYEDAMRRKGIRFDTSIVVEKGSTLYRNDYEREQFRDSVLHPVYSPVGGMYCFSPLYWDAECKNFFKYGTKIESSCDLYYYLEG